MTPTLARTVADTDDVLPLQADAALGPDTAAPRPTSTQPAEVPTGFPAGVPGLPVWVPAGLTVADVNRIALALAACHTESTREIYAGAWRRWCRWCEDRGVVAMPANPAAICAYLTERAATGLSIGSLDSSCSAIAYHHRRHRLPDPLCDEAVRAVRRGLRRIVGTAPRRQARPLGTTEIRQIVTAIDRTTPKGARDAAIILIGYASALRRSELAALTLDDIDTQPGGVVITIRSSKTDQEAAGQCVGVAHGQHADTDPVAALQAWMDVRGAAAGPLFTSMRHGRVTLDPLVPAAIAIAIVREDLFDIRRATARATLYLTLTGLAIATYAAVVTGTTAALSRRTPFGSAVLAALTVAIGFNPARIFLQRRIDRLLYGSRTDPAHAVARIVGRLEEPRLEAVLDAVCETLRLPWAVVSVEGRALARSGQPTASGHVLSLGDSGTLRIGHRSGEAQLSARDLEILAPVAHSLAVAVRAERTAADLQTARSQLVTAREEERRRLGRELHDGVGSALAAVILTADAARRQGPQDPRTGDLLADIGRQTRDVADEVRRLARGLRPPILDSLGLDGALREYATLLVPLDVAVDVVDLPRLPAADEVAAYRIVIEALTNVVRHARATEARVAVRFDNDTIGILVEDNGPARGPWLPGVGLTSMAERATELGGSFRAGPRADQSGGRVEAHLPRAGTP